MDSIKVDEGQPEKPLPDVTAYKKKIAKVILYKKTSALVRPIFPAFQGNIATYLVSLLSERLGDKLNLDKIWKKQDISVELRQQLKIWANEVNDVLHRSSDGKMISEWAKRSECWYAVRNATYSTVNELIPELQ